MPPTTTTRGSGLSRSEAAILAWKKRPRAKPKPGALDPKIAARVKQILAEKARKKGPKAKAKPKAKPKGRAAKPKGDGRTPQEKANQNRAAVAKQGGMDKLEGTIVRLGVGMNSDLEKDAHEDLIKKGLVERGADGKPKLSAAGKKWKAAADKGNVEGASAALAEGAGRASERAAKEKVKGEKTATREKAKAERTAASEAKKQERIKKVAERQQQAQQKRKKQSRAREKVKREPSAKEVVADALASMRPPKKAIDMTDLLEIKAGARHSRTDMQHLQGIHDSAVACGASCGSESDDSDDADTETAEKAIKALYDDPVSYAMHECNDIGQACSALQTLCFLLQSELSEGNEDEDTVPGLVQSARLIVEYIGNELDMIEEADKEDTNTIGHEPMKAITAREDVNPKAGVAEYGAVAFADAKNKKYPIDTEAHIRSAWNYINKDENAAKYAGDEVKQIKAKIVAAWKKTIDDAGPPSAGKAVDDAWLHIDGGAIKAVDDTDTIRGLAILYGTKSTHDLERDYYDKNTDLWLDHWGWPRPITYHHGIDKATRDDPVVGHWTKATVTDEGVWLEGQLDRAHRYYKAVKELARRGYLKISSDSGPQWTIREPQSNGANYIKRWPLVTASVTVTPMEPRMLPVEVKAFLADLGYEAIDDSQEAINPDAAKADGRQAADDERARRLLLEWELFNFEMETS